MWVSGVPGRSSRALAITASVRASLCGASISTRRSLKATTTLWCDWPARNHTPGATSSTVTFTVGAGGSGALRASAGASTSPVAATVFFTW